MEASAALQYCVIHDSGSTCTAKAFLFMEWQGRQLVLDKDDGCMKSSVTRLAQVLHFSC